ncbi:MAG: phenylalanine--tRNA ligase subunit alpha [Acidiphilium sp. 37-64-53]|uniref:phenylalanine--tRNA ligase subunit alpha n=1 Tax=Acidiphilium TaxID=522 RepID=UPI000BD125DF|nr:MULTISPECIES: phenylalanine--tRNA ligase subunit alpha [Acidiphilium]OYW03455.1 MAG: phenylalanine--tRNA ligase subunit alpha [Acidiphilium sp. 37-64-53]OZB30651.1 MAG: phenylalanine--tRNA ligase subunit alpha [Acidiphilium sp. 34-64-41]HQT84817.1 phenylalanine--tRNA ligase subunit alpha [Acidiphilium rubrum]
MSNDIATIELHARAAIDAASDSAALDAVRVSLLGKTGQVTALLKSLGGMDAEARKSFGAAVNALKNTVAEAIEQRRAVLDAAALDARLAAERIDITLPARPAPRGSIHPLSRTIEELTALFGAMGFNVKDGPDIEDDWYSFGALNVPSHHPARAMMDTFYLKTTSRNRPMVLRPHTSSLQIRTMLEQKPPIRVIVPGRTYRSDHDATHSPMFHQCEGLVIDRGITLAHLKGCLVDFLRAYFEIPDLKARFRSSYFPFTEPSMEIDIAWDRKTGVIGAGSDWLEILGSGMVHPNVLANCGIDPREYQGFAFGMGVERITMLKHGIADLRSFYESDIRWLSHYGTSPLAPVTLHEGDA